MTNEPIIRVDSSFKKILDDINCNRIKMGTDKKMVSYRRLTKAIIEHPMFPVISGTIAQMPHDKRQRWRQMK
jgi:hypothetical protein